MDSQDERNQTLAAGICMDDHSSCIPGIAHCPVHGYDDSVPPPSGFRWHRVLTTNGQIYSALVREEMTT